MENRTYLVISKIANKKATTRMNEAEALELIQEAADEIETFSLLSPSDSSKIRLIKRLDNLQNNVDIRIKPCDKDTSLTLIINGTEIIAMARCSITSKNIKILRTL